MRPVLKFGTFFFFSQLILSPKILKLKNFALVRPGPNPSTQVGQPYRHGNPVSLVNTWHIFQCASAKVTLPPCKRALNKLTILASLIYPRSKKNMSVDTVTGSPFNR